ncbi:hypothetical protein AB8880_00790 [Alphaproteobacteria bacterium LSUCC0684]
MTDKNQGEQCPNSQAQSERQKRESRLAEALRANLHRRKAQKRGRHASDIAAAGKDKENSNG